MESVVSAEAPRAAAVNQRRHHRFRIRNLAYVTLGPDNGGILRDISEAGMAIQSVRPLTVQDCVPVRFELLRPRARVEASGRVVWTDVMGQAGLEFFDVSQRSRRTLKEWLFIQVLQSGSAAADSIFAHATVGVPEAPMPPELVSEAAESFLNEKVMRLPWWPFGMTSGRLAKMVDGVAIASAVLLFSVVALAMTHLFPAWPIALLLAVVVSGMFTGVYWIFFTIFLGDTPGALLARQLSLPAQALESDDQDRFR